MTLVRQVRGRLVGFGLAALGCLAIALAHPHSAFAVIECGNKALPAGDWFACGESGDLGSIYGGVNEGPGNHDLCVGPMVPKNGKYEFPYGWDCGTGTVDWEFSLIDSYPALDNDSNAEYNAFVQGY